MTKPRFEVVSSYVRHDEVVMFRIEDKRLISRWRCSCGAKGDWRAREYHRHKLFDKWKRHLKRKHPDYTLEEHNDQEHSLLSVSPLETP